MGTSYHDLDNDSFQPSSEWYGSDAGKKTIARAYARKLLYLAVQFDTPELCGGSTGTKLRREAGDVVIRAFQSSFLRSIPNLEKYVAWHTASDEDDPVIGDEDDPVIGDEDDPVIGDEDDPVIGDEDDPVIGDEVQSRRVRCPGNLFADVIGGGTIVMRLKLDGSRTVIDSAPVDGILPGICAAAFARGDAAEACRFLADSILREVPETTLTTDGPYGNCQWRHNGKVVEDTMQVGAWKMVEHLWEQPDRVASFDDLKVPVYRDKEHIAEADAYGSFRKAANKFFRTNDIPLSVSISKVKVSLKKRTVVLKPTE